MPEEMKRRSVKQMVTWTKDLLDQKVSQVDAHKSAIRDLEGQVLVLKTVVKEFELKEDES
jgi:hypothetical protein